MILRKRLVGIGSAAVVASSLAVVGVVVTSGGPAVADTSPFLAYCPATTIGDIALPGSTVTGSLSPSPVNSGSTTSITPTFNVQLPAGLVNAAIGLGNSSISGYLSGALDVTGATPASVAVGGPT